MASNHVGLVFVALVVMHHKVGSSLVHDGSLAVDTGKTLAPVVVVDSTLAASAALAGSRPVGGLCSVGRLLDQRELGLGSGTPIAEPSVGVTSHLILLLKIH